MPLTWKIIFSALVVLTCLLALGLLFSLTPDQKITLRVPIAENSPDAVSAGSFTESSGVLVSGRGIPSDDQGEWNQFRGRDRDAIAKDFPILEHWGEDDPRILWRIPVGEGHAGAAVFGGCAYLMDYDEEAREDAVRCLSLLNGEDIWRYSYPVRIKRNHGMSRTVPAVNEQYVVTLGPMGHVHCLKSASGELVWRKDLSAEYGSRIPEWYAGQCPLIESDRVILAPAGKACLMTALDLVTGEPIWETPNEENWGMTHSSIMPVWFEGALQYVLCTTEGVVGVDATDGKLLWKLPDWKIRIANIPSPLDAGDGRILLSGGYNSGAMMVQLTRQDESIVPEILFKTESRVFGAEQHTPIFHGGLIYGIIPGGRLACLTREGERLWVNEEFNFGLGPFMMVDGKMLVLDDNHRDPGGLSLFRIGAMGAERIAGADLLEGHEAWAPMAFASGKLILRDMKTMICVDLSR